MMSFGNVKELEKILKQTIATQSELSDDRVLNALSIYGTELDKVLAGTDDVYESIDQSNTTLLFELKSRPATSDVSMTETEENDDDSITYYKAFRLHLIIYGDLSSDVAIKLVARFRTEDVRLSLYEQGVYLEKIDDPFILNEYKNETMWLRNDIDIDISVKFNILPVTTSNDFADITELNVIQNKEATNV